jgi:hypothetical protein
LYGRQIAEKSAQHEQAETKYRCQAKPAGPFGPVNHGSGGEGAASERGCEGESQ